MAERNIEPIQDSRAGALLNRLAEGLIAAGPRSIDAIIDRSLADCGAALEADRCSLFLFDEDSSDLDMTHGWCGSGVPRLPLADMDAIPAAKLFPWCFDRLLAGKTLVIPDTHGMTGSAADDGRRLAQFPIRSLILVPIFSADRPIGLIKADRSQQTGSWSDDQVLLLRLVGLLLIQTLLRIRADQQLARSAARYRALTKQNQSILYELTRDGHYQFISANVEALTGHAPQDWLGKHFGPLIHPEDRATVAAEVVAALKAKCPIPALEYRVLHKDGRVLWHRSVFAPVRDDDGRLDSLIGNALDVTDLKRIEEDLRYESELTGLLVRLATAYINLPIRSLNAAIDDSLAEVGRFVAADRAYVFAYDLERGLACNTHEWCAAGIEPQMQNLGALEFHGLEDFLTCHLAGRDLYIPRVSEYPDHRVREILREQDVQSLLTTPLMLEGQCVGFVGFDSIQQVRSYNPAEQRLLRVFAQMLVNMRLRSQADESLKREQERLAEIIDGTDAGTWEWNRKTQTLAFNQRWAVMLGYRSVDELPDRFIDWREKVHPGDYPTALRELISHLKGRAPHIEVELRIRHRQSHWVWVLLRGRAAARAPDGRARLVAGIAIDISERKQTERELRQAASVFTYSHEGILIADTNGKIIDVNQSFSRITGFSRQEVIGRDVRLFSPDSSDPGFNRGVLEALESSGHWSGELWNKRRDGTDYVHSLTISTVRDGAGKPLRYLGLFSDITEQKQYQQTLERMAHYDALTGLPNRVLLGDRLREAMSQTREQGTSLAVVYIDIDHFKLINDAHGHEIGDRVLQEVTARIRAVLRETDVVGRPGGDEFVALLTALDSQNDAGHLLQRLSDAISTPARIDHLKLSITVSIGVTFYPQASDLDGDQLLRQADQAMYEAKRKGRNAVCLFDAELERSLAQRLNEVRRLRRALDDEEMVLHYQPQVDLRDGRVYGIEALIRWRHPERGLLPPADFLHLIEDDELAQAVGRWVLTTALADLVALRSAGHLLEVAVNVSARELLREGFFRDLEELLSRYPQLAPDSVLLEFVETGMLEDIPTANRATHACAGLGVGFALDDFGTGFSSLSHLKHLPLRQLKIDRSFVRDMLDDPDDLAIIEGVINLGRSFGLEVLAEGVETADQRSALLLLGCMRAQGYWIAHPMPLMSLLRWLEQWVAEPPAWADQPVLNTDHLALLFARSECRARLARLAQVMVEPGLVTERSSMPRQSSRLQQWLASEPAWPYVDDGLKSAYREFDELDRQIWGYLASGQRALAVSGFNSLQQRGRQLQAMLESRLA